MKKTLMLCDCDGSQKLDSQAIGKAADLTCSRMHSALCTSGLAALSKAMGKGDVVVACAQEASVFDDLAAELECPAPLSVDIRDRAGWSDEGSDATAKIAALLAEAQLAHPASKTFDIESGGLCLVVGRGDVAFAAAEQLDQVMDVTCLLSDVSEVPVKTVREFDVLAGRLRNASGSLGHFAVTVDGLRTTEPGGRGALKFGAAKDGGKSECDLILDLSGDAPLFAAYEKRDGYYRADPGDPLAVARAVFDVAQMVGTFEKPLYVRMEEHLCAHSRASQTGCNRCLNVCPTGAITPDGDHVLVNANICAGCGACASVCPSGAISYDDPPVNFLFQRIRTLAHAYESAGGVAPKLLVHDAEHGREMISLAARFSRGLPANVIPLEISNLAGFGHTEMLVALASGFVAVDLLIGPKTEREALDPQLELAAEMLSGLGIEGDRLRLIDPAEPDALCDSLYAAKTPAPFAISPILPLGGRREATRLAAKALATKDLANQKIPLPPDAPYGAVLLDTEACTLCLACASLCPSGALGDNPDKPQLRFQEDACLQCGICVSTCPENAISLVPQLDLSDDALSQVVINEEEPFECIECGKPFGVKSTIERVIEKLEGVNPMFTNSDNVNLIRMCDDCRVAAQYHSETAPMFGGDRPRVRTTDDYLKGKKPN